jgi:hypothetical protein
MIMEMISIQDLINKIHKNGATKENIRLAIQNYLHYLNSVKDRNLTLSEKWFPESIKKYPKVMAVIELKSPEPFRKRNLFVSDDALVVA